MALWVGKTEFVRVGVCVRVITGVKKLFEKNETCASLAAVLSTLSGNFENKGKW